MKLIGRLLAGAILCVAGREACGQDSASAAAPQEQPSARTAALPTLAGPLPAVVRARKDPYLVTADIEVPVGKTVSIEPGCAFLFRNFTGLHVQGRLVALGTKEKPIFFTSENDRNVNRGTALFPNPYDWNGIYIHSDAVGTSMAYCKILYSVYGILSETKFIRLDPIVARDNGKSNLTIEGKEYAVGDKPYSYVLSTSDATLNGVPVKLLKDPLAPRRNVIRYTSFAVVLGAAAVGVYYGLHYRDSQRELSALQTDDPVVLNRDASVYGDARDQRNRDLLITCIGGGGALVGAIGFAWTFAF
jgi:hypothetical protein